MKNTYKKGLWAERLCCCVLWLKGYSILARRLKTPLGEIDIVACKGKTLAIVEVKYRPFLTPDPIVLPRQRRRLELAASYFAKKLKEPLNIRFDIMLVIRGCLPRHLKGAWRPEK